MERDPLAAPRRRSGLRALASKDVNDTGGPT